MSRGQNLCKVPLKFKFPLIFPRYIYTIWYVIYFTFQGKYVGRPERGFVFVIRELKERRRRRQRQRRKTIGLMSKNNRSARAFYI